MKYTVLFIFLIYSGFLHAQEEVLVFDNKIKLQEGVYTSLSEILENSPKYYNYQFEYTVSFWTGQSAMFYFDESGNRQNFEDTIVMIVEDGARYVNFKNHFCKLILTGAISTFYIENTYNIAPNDQYVDNRLYFWDLTTGYINRLNYITIEEIFRRDSFIYSTYSAIPDSRKKKTLYSYVLQYNSRNPVYIGNQ
jgi:hypothetical protein